MAGFRIFLTLLLLLPLASMPSNAKTKGCSKTNAAVGAVVGGVLGGLLGRKIDRDVGTVVGTLAGGFLGATIAAKLDKCEQEKLNEATIQAANDPATGTPIPRKWVSDTRENVSGTVTAGTIQTTADGAECRAITQVSYVNGEEVRDTPRVCRTPPQTNWVKA